MVLGFPLESHWSEPPQEPHLVRHTAPPPEEPGRVTIAGEPPGEETGHLPALKNIYHNNGRKIKNREGRERLSSS